MIKKLYKNWTVHNIIAHPLMEILHLIGFNKTAKFVHKCTVPENPNEKSKS